MENQINIIIASDHRYLCHATVTILSVLQNSKTNRISFYFLDEGIGEENRIYLKKEISKLNGCIQFIDIKKEMFKEFPVSGHIQQSTYYRIIAPYLLPVYLKKAIYLDSDIIVKADIDELFDIDIGSQIIGAVGESPQELQRLLDLGINNEHYFNAGVLVIELAKWKEKKITDKVFKYIEENPNKLIYWDQDALNAVLDGKWYQLEAKWNVQTKFFELETYKERCLNPAIIHFTTDVKPWHIYSTHPFKQLYLEYREKTRWRNVPLINKELLKKLHSGSKLILFGTGSHAERIVKNLPFEVAYFIDNNDLKHGTLFLDKPVNTPDSILNENNKDDIAIVIASMYTKEIGNQLKKLGFEKDIHFFELHS